MAVKVNGTLVIDDDKDIKNVSDTTGSYYVLDPVVANSSGAFLDFNVPVYYRKLTTNITVTSSINRGTGKSKILLIDTDGFSLNFTSTTRINWQGGTAPNFASFRYWTIFLSCFNGSNIVGSAMGSDFASETINNGIVDPLTYSTGAYDGSDSTDTEPANVAITILTDGTVRLTRGSNNSFTDWLIGSNSEDYEVLATESSSTGNGLAEGTLGVWQSLSSSRTWRVTRNTVGADQSSLNLTIRNISNPTNSVSRPITISAEVVEFNQL